MISTPIVAGKFKVDDRVAHRKEGTLQGTIVSVDDPPLSVQVLWDGDDTSDFQWNEKLIRLED
jgi:hypothetical protein